MSGFANIWPHFIREGARKLNHATPGDDGQPTQVETLLATPHLADALNSEQFRRFLDQVPIAILISEMKSDERIIYANPRFEKATGQATAEVIGSKWSVLSRHDDDNDSERNLGLAIVDSIDFVGTFKIAHPGHELAVVDAYSNIILEDDGTPCYRLAALVENGGHAQGQDEEQERRLHEKDILLLEIQHRVRNNLQLLTALLRIEAREARGRADEAPFQRLAGRIESLQLLYSLLSDRGLGDEVDLGIYLSKIASSVMDAHAVEGIRLDLKVDAYPVSVNVAMPTGLVVNELLTNALKHAFVGRNGGTITLHSLSDGTGCRIIVADDGIGLPNGVEWPQPGKLGALIVQSLRENAKARFLVESSRKQGTRVTILFTRLASAPSE
jgi:PAS domain S-box-containing protein